MRRSSLLSLCLGALILLSTSPVSAQVLPPDLTSGLRWRNIGPANMSGRITDIDAVESDWRHVVVASASGGVWKSVNGGTTWESIFDDYGSASIGAVAIFQPDPDIIWVGAGEPNNRNSVAWGDGVYRSDDGGETFQHMGLEDTHQIARVLTHPTDPDIVWVAAIGHLWGYSGDRGVFKTTDGGRTWERVFYVDEKTGCSALEMDPADPDVLYAGMYQRLRRPWRFDSGGPNGGIFKSTDGGVTWTKLTRGLPTGETGKIGLAVARSNPKVVMAFVEAEQAEEEGDLSVPRSGVYRSEDAGASWEYVNTYNNRPFYYSHIWINPVDDEIVYLLTTRMFISYDGGRNLERAGGGIHGDYHALWADPNQRDRLYVGTDGGVGLTHDHDQTYIFFDTIPVSQFYAVGVDMRDPYYVYGGLQDNGTWGGPSNSRDGRGILTDHWASVGGGDGFHVQVDPTDWRTVYLESQGGSISRLDALTRSRSSIRPREQNILNYEEAVSAEDTERNEAAGWRGPFRFNWSSPIVLSPHNPHTVLFGGNYLFRSVDRGEHWKIISPDLSTRDPVKMDRDSGGLTRDVTGAETHCTIISISESPLEPGMIWVGTDDGNVQLTRNDGVSWTNLRGNIRGVPEGTWVSRVEASRFDQGTAYVTFDGHRSDDFEPYVYKTTDFGASWTRITDGIPSGHSVYVIEEDRRNPDLLFVGTEFGTFFTIDGGKEWVPLKNGLPTVAVHDLLIHPRENDLIAGTHGRGIWIMDDITSLQQLTREVMAEDSALFQPRRATDWESVSRGGSRGHLYYSGQNPRDGTSISFWLRSKPDGPAALKITDVTGALSRTVEVAAKAGVNTFRWDLRMDPTQEAVQRFVDRTRMQVERALEREEIELSPADHREVEQLLDRLSSETDPATVNLLAVRVYEKLGFGGYRRGLRGPQAEPGTYRVDLTVGETTLTTTVEVREDPLVTGGLD